MPIKLTLSRKAYAARRTAEVLATQMVVFIDVSLEILFCEEGTNACRHRAFESTNSM